MNDFSRYQIIESGIGPLISDSRTTVYDVLEAYDEGLTLYDICRTYNLRPLQLETALEYIEEHRERLEVGLSFEMENATPNFCEFDVRSVSQRCTRPLHQTSV